MGTNDAAAGRRAGWKYLNDFTLPPEVLREVDEYCRKYRYGKKDRKGVEEEVKLQYFFGGQEVAYLRTPEGLAVVAAGAPYSEEYMRAYTALTPEERRRAVIDFPSRWNDPDDVILSHQSHDVPHSPPSLP